MTNGDKLRQMTDEELAEFLETSCGCSVCLLDYTAGAVFRIPQQERMCGE